MAMMASRKTSACRSESPASIRCSNLRQTASYSMARGTLSNNVACPCRTARIMAAEAPVGLRMAATTASVSGTSRRAEPHRGMLAFVEKAHDRHPPRPSGFPKMSWIYGGGHGFPGAWDWRQLGDLQSLQCRGIADIGRAATGSIGRPVHGRSEEHTSELQS